MLFWPMGVAVGPGLRSATAPWNGQCARLPNAVDANARVGHAEVGRGRADETHSRVLGHGVRGSAHAAKRRGEGGLRSTLPTLRTHSDDDATAGRRLLLARVHHAARSPLHRVERADDVDIEHAREGLWSRGREHLKVDNAGVGKL